jgi:diacylglycerol kinase (ATP)
MQGHIQEEQEVKTLETGTKITAIIIANPTAGSYNQNKQQIEDTLTYLQTAGWDAEIKLTEGQGDGRRLAKEAVEKKLSAVIAVGGDGTINEVIQELAGSETALGVLPSGTMNVWAREIGIPLDNVGAQEILVHGQTRRIDLGQVNKRYFLLMSTIGLDAEITHTVEKRHNKRFGVLEYIVQTFKIGFGYPNFTVFLQMGKRTIKARVLQVVFGNTQLYAGAIKFTWRAKCDDGLLDISLVRSLSALQRVGMLVDFLLKRKQRQQWVRYESAEEVRIHTNKPVALQVDGDPEGYTNKRGVPPTIIRIMPQSLNVIMPQALPEGLFR